jgi:predicted Rossmann-fold nucleotide-binding protein
LGAELTRRKIGLVYGGGNVGLMGAIADSVLEEGGEAIGVIPEHLMTREIGHKHLSKLHIVRSMHERKALMSDLSDAFIALPGGFGTLEGYYTPLLAMLDHAVQQRFLKPQNRALVLARDKPAELLKALEDWRPVHVEKWLDRETR